MAPPPTISKAIVKTKRDEFVANIERARTLYQQIVTHGYTGPGPNAVTRLSQPARRDVAAFIFFEIAAKFEDFAKAMFQIEVRARLQITATRSEYVMGDLDNGMENKLGWGSPKRLKDRGDHLFGAEAFFGDLVTNLGDAPYKLLTSAHTTRNRIAHDGGSAKKNFIKLLEGDGIPGPQRQGLSVGRYLMDYPGNAPATGRNFFRFLTAYETFADKAYEALPRREQTGAASAPAKTAAVKTPPATQ